MKLIFDLKGLKKAQEQFMKQVSIDSDVKLRLIATDLYIQIKQKTPVWTGSLRASWQMARNSPNLEIKEIKEAAGGGPRNANFNMGKSFVTKIRPQPKKMQPIWISNNLPYASIVEFGAYSQLFETGKTHFYKVKGEMVPMVRTTISGFSTQAPQGMLRVSLMNITLKYKA